VSAAQTKITRVETVRQREFERFHAYQQAEREAVPRGLLQSAEHFIDRFAIEQEAAALIERHQAKESILPPAEYLNNARTALFEALTASGHLSRVEFEGTLEEVNQQVLERLLNGYSDDLPLHERQRRFMELCEELLVQQTHAKILSGELPPDTEVLTISDYPYALSDHAAMELGYNAYNRKGMVRTNGLVVKNGHVRRVLEQLSRSNADPEETMSFLRSHQIKTTNAAYADVAVIATQTLFSRQDFADGVIDIQRRLDYFGGGQSRYGEMPNDTTLPYGDLRKVSALREARVESFAKALAAYEETLDKQVINGSLDTAASSSAYVKKVRELVRQICLLDPRYTKHALGQDLVETYQQASQRLASGDAAGAVEMVAATSSQEREIVICGISTGPEQMSSSQQDALAEALQKQRNRLMLRPKHSNDQHYLVQKYGREDVQAGTCIACNSKRYVAQCSICPDCDFKDTQKPGYVETMLKRKQRIFTAEFIVDVLSARTRQAQPTNRR